MARVVLGLGSNLGDASGALEDAVSRLSEFLEEVEVSSFYRSAPMYVVDQPTFTNAVVLGRTSIGPWPLLQKLKEIERGMGRVERERNGPREIDIDIVVYGALDYRFEMGSETLLQIPHPRLGERRFVLAPLCEVWPDCIIPGKGRAIDLLDQTEPQSGDVVKERDELLSVRSAG